MGRIPDNIIQEVLDKADIESVVGSYVSFIKRSGSNLFGLCPFHSEKTPSFSVSLNKQIYHCFGCQKGGNAINFIMEIERLNYPEAIRFLGNKYGINIPEDDYRGSNQSEVIKKQKDRVSELLVAAAGYYYKAFNANGEEYEMAREYAQKRNLKPGTLKHFGIGYAPRGWNNLVNYLSDKGFTEEEMKQSGLFTVSKKGTLVDLFRGRLMFPIFDSFGKIVAFGGRAMGDEMPKYVNSPDSLVYKKQEHLYALNFAKEERAKQLIIVEGYMDAIAMHQAGVKNTVASLGTAFTDSQLRMCARYSEEVIFFFDADKAGQNAAIRAIRMMLEYLRKMSGLKIKIKIAKVPGGKDPDEFIRVNGAEKFRDVVDSAKYVDEYLMDRAYDDNFLEGKGLDLERYQDDICLYGSWLNDEIKRSKVAGNASVYLKAKPEIILNRMNQLSENLDQQRAILESRGVTRQKAMELKGRTGYVEEEPVVDIPYEDVPPPVDEYGYVSEPEVEAAPVIRDDIASQEEINLFACALNLEGSLADNNRIERVDVIRPLDFQGKNMQEIVAFFLSHFDSDKGVSVALLMGELRKYVINGMPAEEVFFNAIYRNDEFKNVDVLCDIYKKNLYKIRVDFLKRKQSELLKELNPYLTPESRSEINNKLSKIDMLMRKYSELGDDL